MESSCKTDSENEKYNKLDGVLKEYFLKSIH